MSPIRSRERFFDLLTTSAVSTWVSSTTPVRELARGYIAGDNLGVAMEVAADQVSKGLNFSVRFLADRAADRHQAAACTAEALAAINAIRARPELTGTAELSLALTGLGLDVDPVLAHDNAVTVIGAAQEAGILVTIDDEGPGDHDAIMQVQRRLLKEYPDTGVVVQAARHDSLDQLDELITDGRRIRLCKGSYTGPPSVTLIRPHDIDLRMASCLRTLLTSPARPLIATHDPVFVAITERMMSSLGRTDVEFQMLHGIRPLEQRRLVDVGMRMRVYLPYGTNWYEYGIRRLVERPANLWLLSRSVVRHR